MRSVFFCVISCNIMLLYLSYKILYTWQVVGVGAGYIINVFNYKLYREGPTLTFVNHLLRVQLQVVGENLI
jgi:hypothetical protein